MDKNLRIIVELLNQKSISYWIDSGTLLGLVREGDLIEKDNDIDISIWNKHEQDLIKLLPYMRHLGYTVIVSKYYGMTYRYKLISYRAAQSIEIDIAIFREYQDYAWCPGGFPAYQPGTLTSLPQRFLEKLSRFQKFKLNAWKCSDAELSVTSWPWSYLYRVGTWWIPKDYFIHLVRLDKFNVTVPYDWKRYLDFRYGDWKKPVKSWRWYVDDSGFIGDRSPFDQILPNH